MASLSWAVLFALLALGQLQTLRQAIAPHNKFIGAAINDRHFADPAYLPLASAQFSLVTAENGCKWNGTEHIRGKFNFTACDLVYNFAKANNQTFRGHNLCWGHNNPDWLPALSPADKRQALIDHITAVVKRYGDGAYGWDVVNEALSTGGSLKHTDWFPSVPDYVELAFNTTRALNPKIKLFYNDFHHASMKGDTARKSNGVYNFIKKMKAKGVPIDGVGFQLHIDITYKDFEGVRQNIQRYAALGVEVHFTEMDVRMKPSHVDLKAQAEVYAGLLKVCLEEPNCKSFETWGFTDKYTWLSPSHLPLPFDKDFQPKPAVQAMLDAMK